MAVCSQCGEEKARDAFSKAQLRKTGATRRCKQCIAADDSSEMEESRQLGVGQANTTNNYVMQHKRPLPLSERLRADVQKLIKAAVTSILKRGIPPGVGLDGYNRQALEARLWEVANNERMTWLTIPLLIGLVYGKRKINDKFHFIEGQEPHPILMWLCQYKFIRAQFNYCGGDDMIALALSAGADVSLRVSNGCNALFFAVKYGSARTIELLLDAGVDVHERDFNGMAVWKNAVERPDLGIIKVLIDRCNNLIPVDKEVIHITFGSTSGDATRMLYTLPDHMLSMYVGFFSFTDINPNISWRVLGAPRLVDMATALVRVLQAGAQFSSMRNIIAMPDNIEAHPLAFVTHVDSPGFEYCTKNFTKAQLDIARYLRDMIYGRRLPDTIAREVQSIKESCPSDNTCPICLTDMEPCDNPVTLYCGHKYCLECIKSLGKAKLDGDLTHQFSSVEQDEAGQISARVRAEGIDKRCPVCRRLLCGDLLDQEYNDMFRSLVGMRLGIDRHEADGRLTCGTPRGPHLLTEEQLRFECKIIIGKTEGRKESLLEELLKKMRTSSTSKPGLTVTIGGKCRSVGTSEEDMKVELSTSATLVSGTENVTVLYGSQCGPVFVPIQVKGVPILASLSHNSIFTVVPKDVIRSFGLKTKPITSSQFVDVMGNNIGIAEVVDEFRFFLKDIEICLNNAVVLKNEHSFARSVQLGMDFFETSLWNRCSVRLQDEMYVVTDGGYTSHMFMKDQPNELRYYSRDGKICQVPFIHVIDLGSEKLLPIVSLPGDFSAECGECQWCCRNFPCDGMLKREDNNGGVFRFRYYCDEDCKAKGMAIRA